LQSGRNQSDETGDRIVKVLVTGSSGLIGSEAVLFFNKMGFDILGVDNNMRRDFFGPQGDTTWNLQRLQKMTRHFVHYDLDVRDRQGVLDFFSREKLDLIIHTAAQPSHELAATRPFDDFDVNAVGTLNLLEATRRSSPDAVFIHVSTNKVYGDALNHIRLRETETRWDFDDLRYFNGIPEDFPIDNSLHSLFGASKVAADILAQEYGKYFGLKTGIFRGGCLTGPQHSGVELHGFLNYLVLAAMREQPYMIYGYKGKQVRDQIHSYDVVNAFWHFAQNPRPGEVYNLGGGKENANSVIECIEMVDAKTGKRPKITYSERNRIGDHICYYSNLKKLQDQYPGWKLTYSVEQIIDEIIGAIQDREV
jgi:CDP-paratose 2-epimerase